MQKKNHNDHKKLIVSESLIKNNDARLWRELVEKGSSLKESYKIIKAFTYNTKKEVKRLFLKGLKYYYSCFFVDKSKLNKD